MSCHIPKTLDKYIGIEIEFYSKYSYRYVEYMFEQQERLHSFCKLGEDMSIENPWDEDNAGFELRVLTKAKDLKKNLTMIDSFLKSVGAEVNDSCGLHVHLDARQNDPMKMLNKILNNKNSIEKSVPYYRLENDYSNSIDNLNYDLLNRFNLYLKGYNDDMAYTRTGFRGNRYTSINIESYLKTKTIEIRCHEGTVNTAEIYSWCKYLYEVAYGKQISGSSKNYINKRINTKGKYQAKRIA